MQDGKAVPVYCEPAVGYVITWISWVVTCMLCSTRKGKTRPMDIEAAPDVGKRPCHVHLTSTVYACCAVTTTIWTDVLGTI